MGEFRMPSLGADMDAGTVVEWRVGPGDAVHRGDIVAVVDTEKSTLEVEVFEDGVVEEVLVEPGREVPVGTVLARIGTGAGVPGAPDGAVETAGPGVEVAGPVGNGSGRRAAGPDGKAAAGTPARPGDRPFVRASPRARRAAAERGMDLGSVRGTGPAGAVVAADLAPAAPAAPPAAQTAAPPGGATVTGRGEEDRRVSLRRAIGVLMERSKREIPHYYLATTVDLSPALGWMTDQNSRRPVSERLLAAALLLAATARAARNHPAMNGFWTEGFDTGGFKPADRVHLGVAVALRGGGLVAPAIHDADRLSVEGVMAALRDLTARARTGGLRGTEMSDPTITVTNLGDVGAEEVFGVIYPPQVALVGFGRIVERPWAAGGMLGVRPVVRLTLAADHRVSDGHDGARFLATIERLLAAPEQLAKEEP